MRFDVNISVSKEEGKLGRRAEIKNLNSFRSVENAVKYEIERQIELLEKGGTIAQETRGWDEAKQKTTSQRGKEEAHDYRYMPEPDIPPLQLEDDWIESIKQQMSKLPPEIREILNKLSISPKVIEDVLDQPDAVEQILRINSVAGAEHAKRALFWLLQKRVEDVALEEGLVSPVHDDQFIKLSTLVSDGRLSSSAAKEVLDMLYVNGGDVEEIAKSRNLIQLSDESEIEKIVAEVISQNQSAADDVKKGEMKAIGFLVGQVMAKSRGQANPQIAQELIRKHLGL